MNAERTRLRLKALGASDEALKVPRPLTIEEWAAMSPELQAYHLEANGREVQRVDEAEAKKATEASQNAERATDQFFGGASPEEANAVLEMAVRFFRRFPCAVQDENSGWQFLTWFKTHRRAHPQMADFEDAFADLCRAGTISIDMSKIDAGDNRVISGWELRTSNRMDRILTPVTISKAEKEKQAISKMSADEFLKASPELHETRISPIFRAQFEKAVATLTSFHPEYERTEKNNKVLLDHIAKHQAGLPFDSTQLLAAFDAVKDQLELKSNVATHGATRVVEYEPRRSTSELLDNTKLKKKVQSMSATEYAAWLRENPSGRSALDALA